MKLLAMVAQAVPVKALRVLVVATVLRLARVAMVPPLEVRARLVVATPDQVEQTAELVPMEVPLYRPLIFAP